MTTEASSMDDSQSDGPTSGWGELGGEAIVGQMVAQTFEMPARNYRPASIDAIVSGPSRGPLRPAQYE